MPERPTATPTPPKEPLVNENPEDIIGRLQAQLQDATASRDSYKQSQDRYRERLREAEMKLARNHSSPEAMRFRIFLELISGLGGTVLSPSGLAGKPGSEKFILRNAAGVAELAYQELENRPTFGLKLKTEEPEAE